MASENNMQQEENDAIRQSEALRLAFEESMNTNEGENSNNNNGNFTIRINVGGNNVSGQEASSTTIRRRNTGANQQQQPAAQVHARTIDHLPGQTNQPSPNHQQQDEEDRQGLVQHVHIQRNNRQQTIDSANEVLRQRQAAMAGSEASQQQARRLPRRIHVQGRGIRVTARGGNTQLRIVRNGQPNQQQSQQQQQQVARVRVPPLTPQPLPFHGSHATNANSTDESSSEQPHGDRHEFKCLICFEFLQNPASCGKCASRFCKACLVRVAASATPAKCPTCRCDFKIEDITLDTDLKERMQRANSVTCQYQGCNAQLSLNQVAIHEQTCLFVPIKCRFSTFGCEWKGTRQSLAEHEATCPLMQVSNLVEQFRQTRANHDHALSHLQSRVSASNAMMELHASMLRRLQKRNYHPGDFLDLLYTVTCTPARFIYTKDVWRSLTACRLSRGFICNVLAFLPTTLLILRIGVFGFRHLAAVDWLSSVDDQVDSFIDALTAFIVVLTFVLTITIFFKIGKSSVEWKAGGRMEHFLKALCAVASHVVQSEAMNYNRLPLVWLLVCITTTVFPSFVLSMIETVNGLTRTRPTNFLAAGRAVPIILFGIRYGLLVNLVGLPASLTTILYQSLFKEIQSQHSERITPSLFVKDDCFLTTIPRRVQVGYFLLLTLMKIVAWITGMPNVAPTAVNDMPIFGAVLLLLVNYLVNKLIEFGNTLAQYVNEQAKGELLPNQAGVRKVCNTVGCLVFTTWILLLGGIVLSY